jgi:hypothetical protein
MAAGYSVVEAKAAAMLGFPLPQFKPLQDLSKQMSELQNRCLQMGDRTSAQTVADMGINLGRQAQDGQFVIDGLVGGILDSRVALCFSGGHGRVDPWHADILCGTASG